MKFLRLQESEFDLTEYYVSEQPASFVSDFKSLNIIIGANNSRKSRFLRTIIGLKRKLIVDSDQELNRIFHLTALLFREEEEKSNLLDSILLRFHSNLEQNPQSKQQLILDFFAQSNTNYELSLRTVQTHLTQLRASLLKIETQNELQVFILQVKRLYAAVELTHRIYANFTKANSHVPGQLYGSGEPNINFTLPNIQPGIPDVPLKLNMLKKALDFIAVYKSLTLELQDVQMIYIPVLRTSRMLIRADNKEFENTIRNQYKIDDIKKLSIETGLDLYDKIEINRSGHKEYRDSFRDFETFISEAFFERKKIEIVAVRGRDGSKTHIKITLDGEMPDVPIHDLGDGIQGVINLLFPIFTAQPDSWIFIDEPENHLHPGYQNLFIRTISQHPKIKQKNLTFFVNTHSNHILTEGLLGSTDTEILVFSRKNKDSSNILSFAGNEYHTLEMLGVFNTSILISNCSIWVEGVTDRLYIRAFLHAYWRHTGNNVPPAEGLNYSFMEYAGNNIVHYNFDHEIQVQDPDYDKKIKAFFLNSKIFLLADSDFSKEKRHSFYEQVSSKRNNFHYFKTEVPEIENTLPDSVLKSWLTDCQKCDLNEVEKRFKIRGGKEKLGKYFDQQFSRGTKKRRFMKNAEGGTLRSDLKGSLCDYIYQKVLDGEINWELLKRSPIIEKLVFEITNFIESANKK